MNLNKEEIINNSFEIVFWSHGHNDAERFLPLMVNLNKKGVRTLLFFQNFDFRDGLSFTNQKIVDRFGLNVLDYSYFLKTKLYLLLVTVFVRLFKKIIKIKFFYNKCNGLRSKLLKLSITEDFIRNVIMKFHPKISFFDNISLLKNTGYPYGSYFIKKNSVEFGIKCFSICHGGTVHVPKMLESEPVFIDFDKMYEPNSYEEQWDNSLLVSKEKKAVAFGDPRFDQNWKGVLKETCQNSLSFEIEKENNNYKLKLLYLSPNLEQFNEEDLKYKNLSDVVRIAKDTGNSLLLIKPHPRYRQEEKIKKLMKRINFKDYHILEDEPLVCYLDFIDFIITTGTSALHDALPENYGKIIIYDTFGEGMGLRNIFKESFINFDSFEKMRDFFKKRNYLIESNVENAQKAEEFSRRWVAAGGELNTVIERISDDLCKELGKIS
ncbi:MAG: hypothetical protein HY761_08490 [Candidatus Omnitrophica bacterium]|nr:hypothetical protein [Candidatus Omnitrophota bacterium]